MHMKILPAVNLSHCSDRSRMSTLVCVFMCLPVCVQPLPVHRQKDNNSHVLHNSCTNMTAVCDTRGLPTGQ